MRDDLNREAPDKKEEPPVVIIADTVVKPDAVMIKFRSASVASPAVLRILENVGITKITIV